MARGLWLLLLMPFLVEMATATYETDPPQYPKNNRKHPNTTYTMITEMCFLKVYTAFQIIGHAKGRICQAHQCALVHRKQMQPMPTRYQSINLLITEGALTPIKYMEKTASTIDSDNTKKNI